MKTQLSPCCKKPIEQSISDPTLEPRCTKCGSVVKKVYQEPKIPKSTKENSLKGIW